MWLSSRLTRQEPKGRKEKIKIYRNVDQKKKKNRASCFLQVRMLGTRVGTGHPLAFVDQTPGATGPLYTRSRAFPLG